MWHSQDLKQGFQGWKLSQLSKGRAIEDALPGEEEEL
jgi:hypothetical protein